MRNAAPGKAGGTSSRFCRGSRCIPRQVNSRELGSSVSPSRCHASVVDNGANIQFAWPSATLEPVVLEPGQAVRLTATGDRGVVTSRIDSGGRLFYAVALAEGGSKTVTEDGVRIAVETDPVARLRDGEL